MKVSREFLEAFNVVHSAFRTPPAEIEAAKEIARANIVAAEDSYRASAAMLAAGWDPTHEQAAAFVAHTSCADPTPPWRAPGYSLAGGPAVVWPSLSLEAA